MEMTFELMERLRAMGVEEFEARDGSRVRFFPPEPARLDMQDEATTSNAMPSREEVEAMRREFEMPEGK